MNRNNSNSTLTLSSPTPSVLAKLIQDITARMQTLGNLTFNVTQNDRGFLSKLLITYDPDLIYDTFYAWTEKKSAKSKTDLYFFQQDFTTVISKILTKRAEKEAVKKHDEAERCPVCKYRLISGECYTKGCSNNKFIERRLNNPDYQYGLKVLHNITENLHRKDFRNHALLHNGSLTH